MRISDWSSDVCSSDLPESCVRKLFILRNSHASQGKEVERLARIWFLMDKGTVPDQVLDAYRGTKMVLADPEKLAAFLASQARAAEREAALQDPMWIIATLGHQQQPFPADAVPITVRDDIH